MQNNGEYYVEYTDFDLSHLENWEKEVVELLKESTKICGKIYGQQKNSDYPGGNFYPHDVTKEELETAAVSNSGILHPHKVVQRDSDGQLAARTYCELYNPEVKKLQELLSKSSEIYNANGYAMYAQYLNQLAIDLEQCDFEESAKLWIQLGTNNRVDIVLGPIETYQDRLMGVKKAFQANLRITDVDHIKGVGDYIETVHALLPDSPYFVHDRGANESKLDVRVDKVIAMGGWHSDLIPRTSNYPADIELLKYGTKIIIYTNNIEFKQQSISKIIEAVLESDENQGKQKEKLDVAAVRLATSHEIAETISKYTYPEGYGHLKELEDAFIEVHANVLGMQANSVQVLKGTLSTDDYEHILMQFLGMALRSWVYSKKGEYAYMKTFGDGYVIVINFLIEKGAIEVVGNRVKVNFSKMHDGLEALGKKLDQYLVNGDTKIVKDLFAKYAVDSEFEELEAELSKIVFK